ncbi:MAG: nitroreductase family protein [Dehalococcoidia bacterium]|nr:MAG: nitroreductase family protein [Dehalococcoidia bacterium]
MNIPAKRWYKVINTRRSRRRFNQKIIEPGALSRLTALCKNFQPFPDARSVLVKEPTDSVFKGAIGPYGKIKGAPYFIVFIGNMDGPNVYEQVGYTGEGLILEAESLNLATCWVAGFFKRKVVKSLIKINSNERVLSITPIGYANDQYSLEEKIMTGFGLAHKRKSLSDMVTGLDKSEWPQWTTAALEAARLAPSAVNRQPWRFDVSGNSVTVSVNTHKRGYGLPKRLCCGIAMLHIEVAALSFGVTGKWDLLDHPLVARFKVETKNVINTQ